MQTRERIEENNMPVTGEEQMEELLKETSEIPVDGADAAAPAKKKKKKKVVYVDDGHTVYSMENVGRRPRRDKKDEVSLTRKEKRAAILAALGFYMPRLLLVIGCFALTGLLLYFWLK